MQNYRIYSSAAYTVFRMGPGVEILQLGTNATQWLQGDEANDTEASLEVIPARVPVEKVETATDDFLSQWFGGDQ